MGGGRDPEGAPDAREPELHNRGVRSRQDMDERVGGFGPIRSSLPPIWMLLIFKCPFHCIFDIKATFTLSLQVISWCEKAKMITLKTTSFKTSKQHIWQRLSSVFELNINNKLMYNYIRAYLANLIRLLRDWAHFITTIVFLKGETLQESNYICLKKTVSLPLSD